MKLNEIMNSLHDNANICLFYGSELMYIGQAQNMHRDLDKKIFVNEISGIETKTILALEKEIIFQKTMLRTKFPVWEKSIYNIAGEVSEYEFNKAFMVINLTR